METETNYTIQFELQTTKEKLFNALNKGMGKWWGNLSNTNFSQGGQFTITFDNSYWWTFKILEYRPNNEIIWKCIDGEPEFNKEWIGHVLYWRMKDYGSRSILLDFQQIGLTPELHCYETCSTTWNMFLKEKLMSYLE